MHTGKVYSYLRFSTAKQAAGSSAARQVEYAAKWAADNGRQLDSALSMRDEGLSAYHQKHIKTGALGVFLEAINAGKIAQGSVLIVEGLDRLSRAEPILAQAQLAQIVNAGVTVITASDNKAYNRESLKANPMDLVYSLLVMIRAHEESETKSKRVSAAVRRKCEAWRAGGGKVPGGRDPSWVRWNGAAFELDQKAAEATRAAITMYTEGYGPVKILQVLSDKGISITGDNRAASIDHLITKNPRLFIGERAIRAQGVAFTLEGYYPALLTPDEFARLITAIAARRQAPRRAGGKSIYPGMFTGLGIAYCGHCGGRIVGQNQIQRQSVYRRLRCPTCELSSSKHRNVRHNGSCNAQIIEKAILDYCSDQFNLESLTAGSDQSATKRAARAAIAAKVVGLEQRIGKMLDAALDAPDALPQAVLKRMVDLENDLAREKAKERELAAEISVGDSPAAAVAWSEISAGVLALDYNARLKCRQLVADTFKQVQIFFRGAILGTPENLIDVMLVSKSGESRLLRVDRKTGNVIRALKKENK